MAKNEITMTNKQLVVSNHGSKLSPYAANESPIARESCKLCQSDLRAEAEELYNQTGKVAAVVNFLKEKGMSISQPAVRNHILYHYKNFVQQQSILEYSEDLQRWVDMEQSKVGSMKKRMAWLDKEMATLQTMSDDLKPEERRKNAETIKKLSDTWLVYQEKLDEYQKTSEPITVIVNQLKIVFAEEMSAATNDEAKRVLSNVMQKMQTSMDDLGLIIENGEVKYGEN